jgi:sarcosine oxidase
MYDAIVIGLGAMGSAAADALARHGRRVLGLEQFAPGHAHGSSHGRTRVIRTAYYEHPAYVPLARQAFAGWYDLEQRTGQRLLTECGCLSIGPPTGELITGVRRAAAEHGLAINSLTPNELRQSFSPFVFDESYVGVLEPAAGALAVEACVQAQWTSAQAAGADLRAGVRVRGWQPAGTGVSVSTDAGQFTAERLVLTAGPWASAWLPGWPLTVMRQVQLWFGTQDDRQFRRDRFPIYLADTPAGTFYGFPVFDGHGHKCAQHYGAPELPHLDAIHPEPTPADEAAIRTFLAAHLPRANGPLRSASVCRYTLSPDRHFIIDRHPQHPQVIVAAGFSGHGFKFAPVVGALLAELCGNEKIAAPSELFSARRLATRSRDQYNITER